MSYLREKKWKRRERKRREEELFSSHSGHISDDSSEELLALVFLENADRSGGEKKANSQNELLAPLGWTDADIEGKIDALHHVTREAVISVFVPLPPPGWLPTCMKISQ